jgi:hypothetical protein
MAVVPTGPWLRTVYYPRTRDRYCERRDLACQRTAMPATK